MADYLSPGVYVEEYDNSPRGMEGVGTSTAGFVGMAEKGPTAGSPVLVTGFGDFTRNYGGYLSEFTHGEYRYLAGAVEQFFANGGTRCYIARVIPEDAKAAEGTAGSVTVTAKNEGAWGNKITMTVRSYERFKMQLMEKTGDKKYRAKSAAGFEEGCIVKAGETYNRITAVQGTEVTFEEELKEDMVDAGLVPEKVLYLSEFQADIRCGDDAESFEGLNMNPQSGNYAPSSLEKSRLVSVTCAPAEGIRNPAELFAGSEEAVITLEGGSDGTMEQVGDGTFIGKNEQAGKRTGIQAFLENPVVSILAVPGITSPEVVVSLVNHCENTKSRFAVIDMPKDMSDTAKLLGYRDMLDSTYAAMYHPWIQAYDRSCQKPSFFPPSGAVAGVYARTDTTRGVHKAPANETVSCTGLSVNYSKGEQDILNPAGVNLIRAFPGQGIRIWGARTASSNATFKYVNIRRLFIYVEESIKANTNWVVFEPNDEALWNRVRVTISSFLETLWRNGMLAGASAGESFFVDIGPSTMSQDDIQNGRLICNIGIAPVRPAEFVIFRVTQNTAESGA